MMRRQKRRFRLKFERDIVPLNFKLFSGRLHAFYRYRRDTQDAIHGVENFEVYNFQIIASNLPEEDSHSVA